MSLQLGRQARRQARVLAGPSSVILKGALITEYVKLRPLVTSSSCQLCNIAVDREGCYSLFWVCHEHARRV